MREKNLVQKFSLVVIVFIIFEKILCLAEIKPAGFFRVNYSSNWKEDGFSVGQMRFGVKGDISENIWIQTSLELTNNANLNNLLLYDAYLDVDLNYFNLRTGQYKYRFGLEQSTPEEDLELINKASVVTNLVNPSRDIGLEISKKISGRFSPQVYLSVINGEGSNKSEVNREKTLVARLVLFPRQELAFGLSLYDGSTSSPTPVSKDRVGVDIKYEQFPVLVKAEYIQATDKDKNSSGYYLTAGYNFTPKILALVRYDVYDPDTARSNDLTSRWTIGIGYYLGKNVLSRINYENANSNAQIEELLIAQVQVKF